MRKQTTTNYAQYKTYAVDFIERSIKHDDSQSITDIARNLANEIEVDYSDSLRRSVSNWVDEWKLNNSNRLCVNREAFSKDGFTFNLPDGDSEIENFHIRLPKRLKRIGVISDVHLPYHDRDALTTALKGIKDFGADCIIINGDLIDCYQLSRFEKNKYNRSFKYEIDLAKLFFGELRNQFPDIDILFHEGNHDLRMDKYVMDNASELSGLIDLPSVLKLHEYRIKHIPDTSIMQVGKLSILHGHKTGVKSSLNPARAIVNKLYSSTLVGHFHKTDESYIKDINGDVKAVFATGCLCKMNPKYWPINNWNHGYAMVEVDSDGNFEVQNKKIFL